MTNRKTTVKAEGKYTIEDMQKHASVASTADGLKLEGPNFKLTCLTACPDMLLFACEELAKANELADELLARVGEAEARLASAAITGKGSYPSDALNKFAIEQRVEAAKPAFIAGYQYALEPVTSMHSYNQMLEQAECYSEQLRKEQE